MGKAIIALIITFIVGIVFTAIGHDFMNTSELGTLVAISVMGAFIILDIHERTIKNIKELGKYDTAKISEKIRNLDFEWDTERVLETNAATIIILSIILGFLFSQWWFILSGIVALFLLQHALQGWCPPLPIIRKLK